jgi:hypothetical protein
MAGTVTCQKSEPEYCQMMKESAGLVGTVPEGEPGEGGVVRLLPVQHPHRLKLAAGGQPAHHMDLPALQSHPHQVHPGSTKPNLNNGCEID